MPCVDILTGYVDVPSQYQWCLWKWSDVNIVTDETLQEEVTCYFYCGIAVLHYENLFWYYTIGIC